eukprot:scaffold42091_cov219-Skeletonema_marinoi.AAC.1
MIAGGTGITPMIQALHAILGKGEESQQSKTEEVSLLYGSRNADDILGGEMLQKWAEDNGEKFNYVDVLSNEPEDSSYKGERGFIDKEKIQKYLPPASDGEDVIIFVCGPPIMYELLCGPRNEPEVKVKVVVDVLAATGVNVHNRQMGYAVENCMEAMCLSAQQL